MKSGKILAGLIALAIGVFLIFYAVNHGPNADISKKVGNFLQGEDNLSQTAYYLMMAGGVVFGLFGLSQIFRGKK